MLEDILSDYKGTLLIVSHDRDFLERIVTRTIIFEQDGSIQDYYGGYTEYKKALKLNNVKKKSLEKTPIDIKKENNNFSYKFKRELELLPNQIDDLTKEINQLEQQLAGNNFYSQDPEGFNQSSKNLLAKKQTLENLEVRWLELEELRQSSNG
jgi:ATP-binding cassette subfamily F protein uup